MAELEAIMCGPASGRSKKISTLRDSDDARLKSFLSEWMLQKDDLKGSDLQHDEESEFPRLDRIVLGGDPSDRLDILYALRNFFHDPSRLISWLVQHLSEVILSLPEGERGDAVRLATGLIKPNYYPSYSLPEAITSPFYEWLEQNYEKVVLLSGWPYVNQGIQHALQIVAIFDEGEPRNTLCKKFFKALDEDVFADCLSAWGSFSVFAGHSINVRHASDETRALLYTWLLNNIDRVILDLPVCCHSLEDNPRIKALIYVQKGFPYKLGHEFFAWSKANFNNLFLAEPEEYRASSLSVYMTSSANFSLGLYMHRCDLRLFCVEHLDEIFLTSEDNKIVHYFEVFLKDVYLTAARKPVYNWLLRNLDKVIFSHSSGVDREKIIQLFSYYLPNLFASIGKQALLEIFRIMLVLDQKHLKTTPEAMVTIARFAAPYSLRVPDSQLSEAFGLRTGGFGVRSCLFRAIENIKAMELTAMEPTEDFNTAERKQGAGSAR